MFYSSDSISTAYRNYYNNVLRHNHNNPALLSLWGENPLALETQIMCHANGTPVPDSKKYTDETGEKWGNTRWPYNANTEQRNFNDPPITYDIGTRMKAIGTTWWDWQGQRSIRLGFDVDSIIGHSAGVGVADEIIEAVSKIQIPWIEIIRSTRGKGRHLYVVFGEPFPITLTHTEHAALARAYLDKITLLSGLDMEAANDVCGNIMWIHHENATADNRGFELIKPATEVQTAHDIPLNWRDHLGVISGSRAKVVVRGAVPGLGDVESGDDLEEMSKVHARVPLDEVHKHLIDWLVTDGEFTVAWVQDHHLLQTHTCALKKYSKMMEEKGTPLRGMYDTDAPATDPGKPNCFLRPREAGGWDVYRFGQGTTEHKLWTSQGQWTHIPFNVAPTFDQLMLAAGGLENPNPKLGYMFNSVEAIDNALAVLKAPMDWPPRAKEDGRTFSMSQRPNDGKIVCTVSGARGDKPSDFPQFVKNPKGWSFIVGERVAMNKCTGPDAKEVLLEVDNIARALKQKNFTLGDDSSSGGSFTGWMLKDQHEKDSWTAHPGGNVRQGLSALSRGSADEMMGMAVLNPWLLVTEPFKPEFPGGRRWNKDSPQLRFKPVELGPDEIPHHPWWDRYLNTLGKDLDKYIKELDWCKKWGIFCGGDYLKMWIACIFRYPFDRLPYLFFYGPQNTGKSMFHETIARLMTRGVESGDKALTNPQGYNGELLNCVLAYIDEVDVKREGKGVYNKVKAWTTAPTISIHPKYHQVFETRNCLHLVQLSNDLSACPISLGDTRITAIYVAPLDDPLPKHQLEDYLELEAPHFMRTLLDMDIPEPQSRLRLDIIETASRRSAIEMTTATIKDFVAKECYPASGASVSFEEFFTKLKEYSERIEGRELEYSRGEVEDILTNMQFPIGSYKNRKQVGNLAFDPSVKKGTPFVCRDGSLVKAKKEEENE